MKKILVHRDSAIVRALKCIKDDSVAYDVAKAIKCLPTYELSDKALKELTTYALYGKEVKVIFIKYLSDVEKIETNECRNDDTCYLPGRDAEVQGAA